MRREDLVADVYTEEDEDEIRLGNSQLVLAFSKHSGSWCGVAPQRGDVSCEDSVLTLLLTHGGELRHTSGVRVNELVGATTVGANAAYAGHFVKRRDGEVVLEVTGAEGAWQFTEVFTIAPRNCLVRRELRLLYVGSDESLLRHVLLRTPGISGSRESSAVIEAPGYPVRSHYPVASLPSGAWPALSCHSLAGSSGVSHAMDAPGSMIGLVAVHDPRAEWSVMCWPASGSEPYFATVGTVDRAVTLGHRIDLASRLTNGCTVEAGGQWISVEAGSWDETMNRFFSRRATTARSESSAAPGWSNGIAIYEIHVGTAPFPDGRDYQPYAALAEVQADLPRIRDLGFDAIQVMPHWPYPGYSVADFLDIDTMYGSENELVQLVKAAHTLGLRVILDIVLHGCIDKEIIRWDQQQYGADHIIFQQWLASAPERSLYRDEHPEWFLVDEDGDTARVYTWAFDTANSSFQDFIIGVTRQYDERLDIDGFRFDAPTWNMLPNWDPNIPYLPSFSVYGAEELFVRMRRVFEEEGRDLLIFTEPSGPLFRTSTHLTYNYDEEWISGATLPVVSDRGYAGAGTHDGSVLTTQELSEWLHFRSLALPPGAATAHHLDSHDTFWWGSLAQFRHEAFGPDGARALFAFFALTGGAVMVYAGAETADPLFYERLLNLRQNTPVLRFGDCDFLSATNANPRILSLVRSWNGEKALVVINFGPDDTEAEVEICTSTLGLADGGSVELIDVTDLAMSRAAPVGLGADGSTLKLMVPMFRRDYRVLRIEPRSKGEKGE